MFARLMLMLMITGILCFAVSMAGAMLAGQVLHSGIVTALMRVNADDSNYDLALIDVRTHITHNLTRHPASDFAFAWSPDGTRLAFLSNRDGTTGIYLMDADGRNLRRMSNAMTPTMLAWSPDGTTLAAATGRRSGLREIYLISLRNGTLYDVSNSPEQDDSAVVWSPDGTMLLYVEESERILVVHIDGTRRQYIGDTMSGSLPAWTPDSQSIVHFQQAGRLQITPVDGGAAQTMADNNALPPVILSPDGTRLAYTIEQESQRTIRVWSLLDSTTRDYPTGLDRLHEMVWSPHGDVLLISAGMPWSSVGQDIYLLALSDGHMQRLTEPPYFYRGGRFQPE